MARRSDSCCSGARFSAGSLRTARICLILGSIIVAAAWTGCAQPHPPTEQERVQHLRADLLQRRARATVLARQAGGKIEDNEYEEAQALLGQALGLDAYSFVAHVNLGVLYMRQDRYYQAAQSLQQASILEPDSALPYYNLGLLYEQTGRWQKACDQYELALERDAQLLPAIEQLAQCYMRLDRDPERVKDLLDQAARLEHRPEWLEWLAVQRTVLGDRVP